MELDTFVDVFTIRGVKLAWNQRRTKGHVLQDVHGDR